MSSGEPAGTSKPRTGVRRSSRNLELWVRPQPSGARGQDAVEWAREILQRYEGLDTPPRTLPPEGEALLEVGRRCVNRLPSLTFSKTRVA